MQKCQVIFDQALRLWIFGTNFFRRGITMIVKRRLRIRWLSLFFLFVLPIAAYGGMPKVSNLMVTDVTTTSFSVIWAANEESTAYLEVYKDEAGTVLDAVITPHPIESGDDTIRTAAEDNGVMKVRVTDLQPDTTYYFMTITTSKSTEETTDYPDTAMSVTTESETVRTYESGEDTLPFSNDVITEPCYLDDGTTSAEGTLLLATLEGGNYPLTAFVGDGVDPPYAMIDLNNVFSRETHENLDLFQGKKVTLVNLRGLAGAGDSIVTHEVPEDLSLSEVKLPEFGLKAGANFISFQLEPQDTGTVTVLDPIIDKISAVWAYDAANEKWIFYDHSGPSFLNRLYDLHSCTGYWLIMDDEASCLINGIFSTSPIQLMPGSNLVGYRSIQTVELMDAIAPIYDKIISIWTYDPDEERWIFYDHSGPSFLNRLMLIEPGKAYWVYVSDYCEW
jgi:hypothetical protein